ncbi:hypothetical protein [Hungatella hathewayi]|uniref:Uncharacterized protein n=1 Tax=Hungatella hathewayi TaxID=154046 RepID=A0A3E3DMB4_9FIRM|nr:hypothetical protein DWX31_12160 [Hungatella hathewayi]
MKINLCKFLFYSSIYSLFIALYNGSRQYYCWVTSISERGWYNMSTYETLSLMIAFGVLIVMITGTKK